MRNFVPLFALALLLGSTSAQASSISIRFDLSQSYVSLLGGTIVAPPDGSVIDSNGVVNVAGAGVATPDPSGAVTVHGMRVRFKVDANFIGAHVVGPISFQLANNPTGNLTAGGSAASFGGPAIVQVNAGLNCGGPNCGFFGGFPINLSGPQTNPTLGLISITGLGTVGSAFFSKAFTFSVSGYTGLLNVVGQEVSRTFPEPGALALLGPGVIALAALGRRRRRR